jgi:ABC-type lipoprotein release transport system permease subunit
MGGMFFTYIWRELRRRKRQAILIALGLALGVGLVITVIAASNGVKDSQATVLHTLYGVGTDITVTKPPAKGSGGGTSFGFRQQINGVRKGQIAAGTKININQLVNTQYGAMSAGSLARVARLSGVSAATGGLALTDVTVSGTVPALNAGSGSFSSSFTTDTFTVDGVDLANTSLGPLSAARLTAGSALTTADAHASDVLVNSSYATAHRLSVGHTMKIGGTSFTITGIASVLTMAAVSRRVREFGTLKALGWRSRRVVGQVMGESLVIGAGGAVLGVLLGYGGAALIGALAPDLTATVGASNAAAVSGPGRFLGSGAAQALAGAGHTVSVALTAPVTVSVIGLAVLLALAGGLIAGSFGGWRAARLRPAAALAMVA